MKRREFLQGSAAAAGAFCLGFALPERGRADAAQAASFAPNAFIRITPDNRVTVVVGKSEMGQNVYTALPLLVAEELDADWETVAVEQSGVDAAFNSPWFPMMLTGGSSSVRTSYEVLRQAGATARAMLVNAAAEAWKTPAGQLETSDSVVRDPATGRSATYGELAAAAAEQPVPAGVTLKSPGQFRLLGKDHKRLDSEVKVTGAAVFGIDVRPAELRYAAVARPPVFGATLKSFDDSKARAMPGVVKVKRVPSGVAVIADSTWRAFQARDALEIEWEASEHADRSTAKMLDEYRTLAGQPGYVVQQQGDFDAIAAGAAQVIEATYEFPFLAHACMEPLNCTVHDRGADGQPAAEIWTGTQMQTVDRRRAAEILGYAPEAVDLHTTFLGGGFGRRAGAFSDFVVEATHVAKGEPWPVKTTWTREDDMRGGQYRPLTVHRSRLALDADGNPLAWHNRVVSQGLSDLDSLLGQPIENFDGSQVEGLPEQPYAVPVVNLEAHLLHSPVTTLWWRSVGHTHTSFLEETLFDEAAHAVGADPLEYRLRLLAKHPRYVTLLERVKSMSGWGREMPAGSGLGVAIEESFGSIVAEVAQVTVADGKIRVEKVWCAADLGFAINPLGVREQMESGIVYGLSAALHGEITLEGGRTVQGNFNNYPVVRIDEAPEIEVEIIQSGAAMGGAGEPGTPPIFPAVGNAIFAATGQRLRSLPFRLA
ncbi:MAG: xanthine dehydrogenase family protein molybdopterin-binding subunit [Xanthomonadales bacterium]|nr:xanthine dehydrogenase family protein molybdopterin-binding subunit [Xanthomonadales bacterium]